MSSELPYIVALDLGVTHVTALVARMPVEGSPLEIVGMGQARNRGMRRGVIDNMELLVAAIKEAVAKCEDMADCRIHSAWISIPAASLHSVNASGRIAYTGVIGNSELAATLNQAKAQHLLTDHYLINAVPLGMLLDGQEDWIQHPQGLPVQRQIEGHYHLMMLPLSFMQNLDKAFKVAGVAIERLIINTLATSEVVLFKQERDGGVCLLDMGASITQIAVYLQNRLILSHTIPLGGDSVTSDIAQVLGISFERAEQLKISQGGVNAQHVRADQMIYLPPGPDGVTGGISRIELVTIMQARYQEILRKVRGVLEESGGLGVIAQGVVLAGQAARVPGLEEMARQQLGVSARLARPTNAVISQKDTRPTSLMDTSYLSPCGLLWYSQSKQRQLETPIEAEKVNPSGMKDVLLVPWRRLVDAMKKVI